MAWNIKDSVTNLFEEGQYQFRFDSATHGSTKGNEKNPPCPQVKWKWINVTPGEYEGKFSFQNFMIRTDLLGIFGAALAGTQAFDEGEDLPDDAEELARICESKLAGQVFNVTYKHQTQKGTGRVFSNIEIDGPSTGNFS